MPNEYLLSAIEHIDARLGEGYAKAHPKLIGAFMQASAIDMGTAVIARAIENLGGSESLESAIGAIADAVNENGKSE